MESATRIPSTEPEEKQCRICFDGPDPILGRLIRPCLCKGTISYVHVKCLQLWMRSPANKSAFFACPQCKYQYRYSRTKAFGIATNPVVIGVLSSLFFTMLVLCASFVTTYLMSSLDDSSSDSESFSYSYSYYWGWGWGYFVSPLEVGSDLIRAAYRILTDQDAFPKTPSSRRLRNVSRYVPTMSLTNMPPGIMRQLFRRFILGLPVVGAGSLIHMLISLHLLAPVQWLARYRRVRRSRDSQDIAAFVIILLLVIGAARALWKVYQLTEKMTKRLLSRAEDAILEVN